MVVALLTWAVCDTAWPLLRSTPLTHDHPTHLFKAWHFWEKMLPSFRLRGFSHYWAFGFPSGELVPPGEELWVALFRALTFAQLDWLKTYSLALFGLLGLITWAGYAFARHYFGLLSGLLCGLLMLWDPGGWAQAGWEWLMNYGCWPNSLGLSFILLAVVAIDRVAEAPSRKRLIVASGCVAAAFVSHQVAVPFLPLLVLLLLADRWFRQVFSLAGARSAIFACALGAALSGFYLLPMLARSNLTLDLGVAGTSPDDIAQRLVEQRLFDGNWGVLSAFGFLGAFMALKRRRPGAFLCSLGTGIFALLSTDIWFSFAHLERLMPTLTKIEVGRMLVGAKILWFPLVAYGLTLPFEGGVRLFERVKRHPAQSVRVFSDRALAGWAIGLGLLLPYASPALENLKKTVIEKHLPDNAGTHWKDLRALLAYTKQLKASAREPYRIAYEFPMHDHLPTIAPVFDDTPIYKVGYTPAQAFWAIPMYSDRGLFRQARVKYVVSDHPQKRKDLRLEKTFGKLRLYVFKGFQPEPFTLNGTGEAELLEFSPERIRIRLANVSPGARLKVHVANIDHWRATLNGRRVGILPAPIQDFEDPMLMEVPAESGELELRYVARAPDILGLLLSFGALAVVCAGAPLARRRPAWLTVPKLRLERRVVLALLAACALVSVGVGLAKYLGRAALVSQGSLLKNLGKDQLTLAESPCLPAKGIPLAYACGAAGAVQASRVSGHYGTHTCWKGTSSGPLEFWVERPIGSFIRGRYESSGRKGRIEIWVGEERIGAAESRAREQGQQFLQFDTRRFAPGKTAKIRIRMTGGALHCFDFDVVP